MYYKHGFHAHMTYLVCFLLLIAGAAGVAGCRPSRASQDQFGTERLPVDPSRLVIMVTGVYLPTMVPICIWGARVSDLPSQPAQYKPIGARYTSSGNSLDVEKSGQMSPVEVEMSMDVWRSPDGNRVNVDVTVTEGQNVWNGHTKTGLVAIDLGNLIDPPIIVLPARDAPVCMFVVGAVKLP